MALKTKQFSLTALLLTVSSFALFGCFPEDEYNDHPEWAYQSGSRSAQRWIGNENHPENWLAKISWPNGGGTIRQTFDPLFDPDNWVVSLIDPETSEVGDVDYFQVWFVAEPGAAGYIRWLARESSEPDAEWVPVGPMRAFNNSISEEPLELMWRAPVEDDCLLYSFEVLGVKPSTEPHFGWDYRFGLIPVSEE